SDLATRPPAEDFALPSPLAPASVMFTSGSTGHSKAARITHVHYTRPAAALVQALHIDEHDVFHGWLPLYHLAAQLDVVAAAAVAGAEVALYRRFSASQFWRQARERGATFFVGFPALASFLLTAEPDPRERDHLIRSCLI